MKRIRGAGLLLVLVLALPAAAQRAELLRDLTAGLFVVLALLAWARRPEWFRARLAARRTA